MRAFVLLAFAATAHADTPKPAVDLLHATPTTIAVSSSVVSATYKPEHLVDGNLATAWNSKTGDTKAWLAIRVPADAKVATIKLTVGFTTIDKKLGDLFTQNPRIKKVRVTHAGKTVVEQTLDPESRALQDIPINGSGGDYTIEILELQPGTKYKETCVSELQVWGTPGKPTKAAPKPTLRIGSLDPPKGLDDDTCTKALFPKAKGKTLDGTSTFVSSDSIPIGKDIYVCNVERTAGSQNHVHELAIVTGAKHTALADRVTETAQLLSIDNDFATVDATAFSLTSDETGVLVEVSSRIPGSDAGSATQTLYHVTKTGLAEVLAFDSYSPDGSCSLDIGAAHQPLPDLDLTCSPSKRVDHYRWNGSKYAKR